MICHAKTCLTKLAGAAVLGLSLVAAAAAQDVVTIGTNPAGTLFNSAGSALAAVMTDTTGTNIRVQPFAGSGPLMSLIEQKRIDLAIVNVFEMSQAMNGVAPFKDKHPDLRVVSSLFRSNVGFIVPASSEVKTLADLPGHSVASQFSAAPIIDYMRKAIMANADVADDAVTLVPVPNTVRGADLMKAGRLDVGFLSMGSGAVAELDAAVGGVRFLSLSPDEKAVERLRTVMPQASAGKVAPAPNRPGVGDNSYFLTYDVVVVAHKDADPALVEKVIKTLATQKEALGAALPHFRGLNLDQMKGVPNIPYHDAAAGIFAALAKN